MELSAKQIAELVNGKVVGNKDSKADNFSEIDNSKPNTLSFLANQKYEKYIYDTKSSVIIVNEDFVPKKQIEATLIVVDDAYTAIAKLMKLLPNKKDKNGISDKASISETAKIGKNVYIGDFVCIEDGAEIGDNTKIYPQSYIGENTKIGSACTLYAGVKVYENCEIGSHCIFHAGVVIGSDGFGFAPQKEGDYDKVPQLGNVVIEDYVEVGANTTIDRGTIGSTRICKGVKLDNLIQVAHNVEIGKNTVIAAQTGISGSTRIGKNCMIGGQVGFVGHIQIADGAKFGAQSGVQNSVENENAILIGSPAMPHMDYKKQLVYLKKLPDIYSDINKKKKEK